MSASKRRKLEEGREVPKPALSALSARRQLAAAAVLQETSLSIEEAPKQRAGNQFSVLQRAAQADRGSPKSPCTARSVATRQGTTSKRSTEKGEATPESGASTPKVASYSSFRLNKQNYKKAKDGHCELRLSDSERFVVLGSFGIKVRSGEVAVLGATLTASETIHWVHAPNCHAIPVIRTSEKTRLELHHDKADKPLLRLSSLSPLYQRIWHADDRSSEETDNSSGDTFRILCTSGDAPKKSIIRELNSPAEWNKAISDITSSAAFDQRAQSSTLVCGPKGAGKSTFSKLLTNRLLTTTNRASTAQPGPGVAVIDLDPGQPEYALAGTVSLVHITRPNLGTPFSHPGFHHAGHRILRSHALASVSPAMSPSLYIQCAMDLYEAYRRTLRNCPLLINTPGWILGTGLDLLVDLITKILPSRVIYMSEDGPFDVIDGLRSATRNEFLTMPSRPSEYTARTGSHLRAMQAMAYFHLADNSAASSLPVLSWDPRPISSMPPWEVRYASKRKGIRGILSYDHQSPPELFRAAIDGMVVAVVEIEDVEAFRNIIDGYDLESRQPDAVNIAASKAQIEHSTAGKTTTKDELRTVVSPEGLPMISNAYDATLDPRYCQAIGLALVRGIDTVSKTLQLISPITGSQIQSARSQGHDIILVHGKFDAPTWAYAEDFFYQRGTASLGSKAEQRDLDVTYEGTDEDGLNAELDDTEDVNSVSAVPWLEILQGNQKRPVGSGVWRVRRDLGRNTGD
ncbi:GRC3 protein [Beauveria bassiana ARSEF 2860]|uniref:Polynucleotide 5'-hydroxyl-kinase GRC3 n=1 Tax=Beauveria bassiana (strain ARSEF 2860) TaxID=655819 RepID=J5K9Q9_BEAB2|nr:GRC3 protein [Beauveria bassiana ARSEF 2860]EJP70881.1 GRC3 protein [Beauveria bassiana ARSEF 2860]